MSRAAPLRGVLCCCLCLFVRFRLHLLRANDPIDLEQNCLAAKIQTPNSAASHSKGGPRLPKMLCAESFSVIGEPCLKYACCEHGFQRPTYGQRNQTCESERCGAHFKGQADRDGTEQQRGGANPPDGGDLRRSSCQRDTERLHKLMQRQQRGGAFWRNKSPTRPTTNDNGHDNHPAATVATQTAATQDRPMCPTDGRIPSDQIPGCWLVSIN